MVNLRYEHQVVFENEQFLLWQENRHLFEEEYLQNPLRALEHVDFDHPILFDRMNGKNDLVNEGNVEEIVILRFNQKIYRKINFHSLEDDVGEAKRL